MSCWCNCLSPQLLKPGLCPGFAFYFLSLFELSCRVWKCSKIQCQKPFVIPSLIRLFTVLLTAQNKFNNRLFLIFLHVNYTGSSEGVRWRSVWICYWCHVTWIPPQWSKGSQDTLWWWASRCSGYVCVHTCVCLSTRHWWGIAFMSSDITLAERKTTGVLKLTDSVSLKLFSCR